MVAGDGIPPGLFTTFFRHKGKKDVIGSWNAVGVGSCMFPNNKVLLNTTETGGTYYDECGDLIRMWYVFLFKCPHFSYCVTGFWSVFLVSLRNTSTSTHNEPV